MEDRLPETWAELKGLYFVVDILQMVTMSLFETTAPGSGEDWFKQCIKTMDDPFWWPELIEPCTLYKRKDTEGLRKFWADNMSISTIGEHWHIYDKDKDESNGRGFWLSNVRLRKWRETGSYEWEAPTC